MTASALTPQMIYLGDGTSTAFAAPFRFLAGTLVVDLIDADNVVTRQSLGVHYTLTGGDDDSGGTVTMATAPASGKRLRIRRFTPRSQQTDYQTNDTFPAETHEEALDRQTLINQEQDVTDADIMARAVIAPDGKGGAQFDRDGLGDGDLLEFRSNTIRRFPSEPFSGKFYAGEAVTGRPIPSPGTGGGDTTLRADLADADYGLGGVGYVRSGSSLTVPANARSRAEDYVLAEDWGVKGNNDATVTLRDGSTISMGQAAQNALDECPLGATLIWPAGPINMGADPVSQTRWISQQFQRATDMRFTKPSTDNRACMRINVSKDIANGIVENRQQRIEGNGGRIWAYTPASMGGVTTINEGGNFALTIGDGWDETDAAGADYCANLAVSVHRLRLGGGKIGSVFLDGPNPHDLPGGPSYPETHFIRFYDCLFDGGVYDFCSDGNCFVDCNVVGDNACAYTFDKVPGAFNTLIMGGTSNCGAGNLHIINGDMIWMVRHQAEITYSYGDSTAPYGAQFIFQGLDRPVTRCGLIGTNIGAGERITNAVALENTEHAVLMDCMWGASKPITGSGADLYLGDNAKHTHLIRPQMRWPEVLDYGSGPVDIRSVQARGIMADASRRMRIASASAPHRNPHFGIWLQIGAIMGAPSGADDGAFLNSWVQNATAGLEAMLDGEHGIAHLAGGMTSGSLTAAPCNWPKWLRQAFDGRIGCLSDGGYTSRPHGAANGIGAGTALPDANIWLDGTSWPIRSDHTYYPGIY